MYATKNLKFVDLYFEKLKNIKLHISGEDLINIGIKPSQKFQHCFDYVLSKKLENPALNKEQEIQLAKDFFKL